MKITRRILGVSLSALLLAGSLAGCTKNETPTPSPTPTAQASAGPTGAQGLSLVDTPDMVETLLGFPRDTVLLTVKGVDVRAEDFLYFLSSATTTLGEQLYGDMSVMDWEGEVEGTPVKTYLLDSAVENAQFYATLTAKAAEYGVAVSDENRALMDSQLSTVIEQVGGTEEYGKRLQMMGISDEGFRRLNDLSLLYSGIQEHLFGENGQQPPTDEELAEFAETTADAMMAKHILIRTVDDNKEPLSEEEQAAAKTKAEDLLAQLRASDDPLSLFDSLMNENSEDGRNADGTLGAPDGYLFFPNQMVPEFEAATRTLAYNEISDLVESEYGYHIILRLAPVNDEVRSAWASSKMNDQVDQWMAEAKTETETAEKFSSVDPQTYFEKLTALQKELSPTPSPTPVPEEPTGNPTPTPTAAPAE